MLKALHLSYISVFVVTLVGASSTGIAQTKPVVRPDEPTVALAAGQPKFIQSKRYVPGEIIVRLKGQSQEPTAINFLGKSSSKVMTLKTSWSSMNLHQFSMKPGQDVEAMVESLRADPAVDFAEPNYIFEKQAVAMDAEVYTVEDLETLSLTLSTYTQTAAPIHAFEAWSTITNNLTPPVVAIIDTGIDLNHRAFTGSGALWTNSLETPNNGIDDDHNGYIDDVNGWNFAYSSNHPMDDDGHGTHVSGIVLGVGQDIRATVLDPAKIRIMPLKFLDRNGEGTTSDAVDAIYYAVKNGARVINNSWGGGNFSNSLLQALAYAYDHRVVVVAASGNRGSDNDASPIFPSNYNVPSMLSVAATSDFDILASFSNFGASTVNVGSPGVSILSSVPGNGYSFSSGTSMASPFVAGVAALMLREQPALSAYQVKNMLLGSSLQLASLNGKVSSQSRIDVHASVVQAKAATPESTQPSYDPASYYRSPASEEEAGGGCGIGSITAGYFAGKDGGGSSPGGGTNAPLMRVLLTLLIILLPLALALTLRRKAKAPDTNEALAAKRRFTRYQIESQVQMKVGDQELVGNLKTISLGGAQIDTRALLEKGGTVTLTIHSPDGQSQVVVDAQVVWQVQEKSYGLQFSEVTDTAKKQISAWTAKLVKN